MNKKLYYPDPMRSQDPGNMIHHPRDYEQGITIRQKLAMDIYVGWNSDREMWNSMVQAQTPQTRNEVMKSAYKEADEFLKLGK